MSPGAIAVANGKVAIAEGNVDVIGNCCFCRYCDCVPITFEITFSGVTFCSCIWSSPGVNDRSFSWNTDLNATHTLIRETGPGNDCVWHLIVVNGMHVFEYNSVDGTCSGGIASEVDLDYEIRLHIYSSSLYLEVFGDYSLFWHEVSGILGDDDCLTTFGPYTNEQDVWDCGVYSTIAYDGEATFEGLM